MAERGAEEVLVSIDEVREAAEALEGKVLRTPLLPHLELAQERGGAIRLKCESLQRTGSFKARGALNFVRLQDRGILARGVITYSSGNHAQAVAHAARVHGVRAVVVMPRTAPEVKREGARRLGAEIIIEGTTSVERKERAEHIREEEGLVMVPPFDAREIIAGQGTVALEALEDWPEVDLFIIPIGGGGLASGCGVAIRHLRPSARVVGVEAEGAASMRASLDRGEPATLDRIDTIADGLAPVRPARRTFDHVQALFDDVVTVPDDAIVEATRDLLLRRKLVVEFSGAAALAAVLTGAVPVEDRKAVVVLSGGNMDPSRLREVLV